MVIFAGLEVIIIGYTNAKIQNVMFLSLVTNKTKFYWDVLKMPKNGMLLKGQLCYIIK